MLKVADKTVDPMDQKAQRSAFKVGDLWRFKRTIDPQKTTARDQRNRGNV